MTNLSLVKGSLLEVARGGDVALALLKARLVLICDRSGSMEARDARGGRARYEVEDEIVARLQGKYPGQVALIAFHSYACLCPDGKLPEPTMSTNMAAGLELAAPLIEAGTAGVLLSDGEPDSEADALAAARALRGKLDCIYVGPEGDPGKAFMRNLARAVGGDFSVCDLTKTEPKFLQEKLERLLLAAPAARKR